MLIQEIGKRDKAGLNIEELRANCSFLKGDLLDAKGYRMEVAPCKLFFPLGTLVEWGMPMGREGRYVLLPFLADVTQGLQAQSSFVLWINGFERIRVFAPAWFARGIVPEKMVFMEASDLLEECKRIFHSHFFKVIIIDTPSFFSLEECLFLKRTAEKNRQIIFLIRDYFLSNQKGNIACSFRINVEREEGKGKIAFHVIKGLSEKKFYLEKDI